MVNHTVPETKNLDALNMYEARVEMEDFFYFTHSTISLVEIAEIADEFNYQYEYIQSSSSCLNIYSENKIFWQMAEISEDTGDFASFSPSDILKLQEFHPSSSFIISYHLNTLEKLSIFLKCLLEKYGGWIGTDFADFEPIYELHNIEALPSLTRLNYNFVD